MPSEMSVPFRLNGNGGVVAESNEDRRVRLHVLALLNTHPMERVTVPGYGTDLVGLLFGDPDADEVATQTTIRVQDAMATYEPGVELVRAEPNYDGSEENLVKVDIEYRRLDAPDSGAVANTNMAIIGANGVVREIVRG